MKQLSIELLNKLRHTYYARTGLAICPISPDGEVIDRSATSCLEQLPILNRMRKRALEESIRWGEAQPFCVAPGIMSWVVPLMDRATLVGGLQGGYVFFEEDTMSNVACVNFFVAEGGSRQAAEQFIQGVPFMKQHRMREAADRLFNLFYDQSGWEPIELHRNRERMIQQRQIAEEIHQRKVDQHRAYPYDDERILLSMIRGGDRAGARQMFNKMLAAMFLYSPKPVVVRARAIEMMGYLVRTAVEDSPYMEPLLERHMKWIEQIVDTQDFEDLCNVLREALDDFMNSIFLQGMRPTNPAVGRALDFIAANYPEPISLKQIAEASGLSIFRIAHLIKESTGRTALQNVHYLRIQEARRLLESSDLSCTEIAYESGFGDQSYFIKQFRKWMGTTPAKYRKSLRT